jgi:membrane protein implicated in regulation of membrane protease activity
MNYLADPALLWIIAGFAMIIVELMTGTFYLLVLGVGAFAGAVAAWLGAPFLVQVLAAGVVSLLGVVWVNHWHKKNVPNAANANVIDMGQAVIVERWVDPANGALRVRYRGVEWDARWTGGETEKISAGATVHITGQDGQTWLVARERPRQ